MRWSGMEYVGSCVCTVGNSRCTGVDVRVDLVVPALIRTGLRCIDVRMVHDELVFHKRNVLEVVTLRVGSYRKTFVIMGIVFLFIYIFFLTIDVSFNSTSMGW